MYIIALFSSFVYSKFLVPIHINLSSYLWNSGHDSFSHLCISTIRQCVVDKLKYKLKHGCMIAIWIKLIVVGVYVSSFSHKETIRCGQWNFFAEVLYMDVKLMSNSYYSQVASLDIILKCVPETTQTWNTSIVPMVNT